ncbi:hypothetical protein M422DRAFT_171280 [Sphaerobolus stellatus SS14]|uniref:Cytochrome P450 n=1 Tax=Sphaerobolus stellatus (strain SS14) TaxID=990650 RepID=A0A0C9VKM3_SPHS4|nr:hypothetical protein M422DRAFT_171280 [Sphaerobolus stellatus SS14]
MHFGELFSLHLPPSWWSLDVSAICIFFIFLYSLRKWIRKQYLPPGPKGWPIIGNVLDLPKEKEWLKFTQWKETYGDIVYLSIMGSSVIILNSAEIAHEILFKKSNIYSERPHLTMAGELVGWNNTIVLRPYGPSHRYMRRLMHQSITPEMWPIQEKASAKFLRSLLLDPQSFREHIRYMAGSIILKMTYGYDVMKPGEGKDPFVDLAEIAISEFSAGSTAGAFLVDFIPWLKYIPIWFPGASFQRIAAEWRKDLEKMTDTSFLWTKKQVAAGTAAPSLVSIHVPEVKSSEEEELLKWAASSMYGGGADTTVSAITSFFLCMCLNPGIQAKAQAELDQVIGNGRLPVISDRKSLPYVEAVMKELFRWAPVAPAGVPHQLTKDDNYNGYHIPEGSIIVSNIWAMMRDPKYFTNPDEFRPERFLEEKRDNSPHADPLQIVFGFGRRVCPGQRLAESSVFLAVATTLMTFNIEKEMDLVTGNSIEPTVDVIPGTIVQPVPFPCRITPRSRKAIELVEKAVF